MPTGGELQGRTFAPALIEISERAKQPSKRSEADASLLDALNDRFSFAGFCQLFRVRYGNSRGAPARPITSHA